MTQITGLMGVCLELMKDIPNKSVDMILCDLPYGTTIGVKGKPLERKSHSVHQIIETIPENTVKNLI